MMVMMISKKKRKCSFLCFLRTFLGLKLVLFISFSFQINLWRYGDFTGDDAKEFGYSAN